jgi:hypothetical protein
MQIYEICVKINDGHHINEIVREGARVLQKIVDECPKSETPSGRRQALL